jgi:hypothetical protein
MTHTQLLCVLLKSNGIANQDDMIKLNGRITQKKSESFFTSQQKKL